MPLQSNPVHCELVVQLAWPWSCNGRVLFSNFDHIWHSALCIMWSSSPSTKADSQHVTQNTMKDPEKKEILCKSFDEDIHTYHSVKISAPHILCTWNKFGWIGNCVNTPETMSSFTFSIYWNWFQLKYARQKNIKISTLWWGHWFIHDHFWQEIQEDMWHLSILGIFNFNAFLLAYVHL